MKKITGRFNINVFIVIGVLIVSVYFLNPSYDRLYMEAYNCVDYEFNQIEKSNFDKDIETAFEQCSAEIYRLTKSIYQEIIENGKSNYVTTNIDYYFYQITGYFIFGMDDVVRDTIQKTAQEELKQKFQAI